MFRWMGPAFGLLAVVSQSVPISRPLPVSEIVQRYSRGEGAGDLSPYLRGEEAYGAFLRDLKREAGRIPRQVVAVFALEAARQAFEVTPMDAVRKDLPNALAILEVGCSTLRDAARTPSEFELRWHVLAGDLITSSTRRRSGSAETSWVNAYLIVDPHFKHVRQRNDSDPQILLSLARHELAQFYVWRWTLGVATVKAEGGVPKRDWSGAPERLQKVVDGLKPLVDHPDFADEARVRSGDALVHQGRDKEAFALLGDRPLKATSWEHLRRLIRARVFIARGSLADASREYDAALLVAPRDRTANLAQAGLAYVAGQHDLAERLAKAVGDASEPDRWIAYMYPGAENWSARVAALRKDARGQ